MTLRPGPLPEPKRASVRAFVALTAAASFALAFLFNAANVAADSQTPRIGVVVRFGQDPKLDDSQLRLSRELGASVLVMTPGDWPSNEKKPGQYAFSPEIQRMIGAMSSSNMQMLALLFGANPAYSNPLDPGAFAKYAAWIATTLSGGPVAAYQIWNEPSNFYFRPQYGGSWNGRGDAPWLDKYADFAHQATVAIRAADPTATVLVNGEGPSWIYAAQRHPQDFRNVDGVGVHPYTFRLWAESVPWGGSVYDLRDGVETADSDHSLTSFLRIAATDCPRRYLGATLGAWVTEYGFPTCDGSAQSLYACVSGETQAAYHARGLILGLSQGVKLWTIYELADEGQSRSDPEQNFGVVRSAADGYTPKPAFYAIQRVAQLLGSHFRPIATSAPASVEIPATGSSHQSWRPVSLTDRSTVAGVQVFWFATDKGYTMFVWNAGPFSDDVVYGRVVAKSARGRSIKPRFVDLISGKALDPTYEDQSDSVIIDHLPIGSRPIGVQLQAGQ